MSYTPTPALFLGLTLLLATGCDKEDDTPGPLPAPTATYSRSIVYADNGQHRDTTFQAQQLEVYANRDAQSLALGVNPATTTEGIGFVLDRAKLPAALTRAYTLKTLQDQARDAEVTYYYDQPASLGGGTVLYLSNSQHLRGTLTITAYDTKRQLLSGTYTTTLEGTDDPTASFRTFPKRECDITITGTFTNVPLKTTE